MSSRVRFNKNALIVLAVLLWLPAVAFGLNVLWKYSTTPGHPATPASEWPANAPVERATGRWTLVMFVHPECPCSRASLGELAILMAHARGQLDVDMFFYLPASEPGTWARNGLWRSASDIPGVRPFEDREAGIARNFGAFTSGQTLLYDPAGRLRFTGGITAFRGHSGDNAGRSAITALLQGDGSSRDSSPVTTRVFGCGLRGEQ